jgi:EAL domain-containing protein (putative c-di-GMP-specific phosphodiesterase class I)
VAVNVSGRQLEEPGLVRDVESALLDSGLAPEALLLEITESAAMRDTAHTLGALRALKALGVRLAIDDFGTGYSSLSYLQRFPIDVLKIDRAFVAPLGGPLGRRGREDEGRAFARTVLALADALGLGTVAEGVESPAQRDALVALGCTLGQGFLFARPVPPEQLGALVGAPDSGTASFER